MVKYSRKIRGGVVSLPDIYKAVETVNGTLNILIVKM